MKRQAALRFRQMIESAAETQTDEAALESIELFTAWEPGMDIVAGKRYREGEKLYRAVQSHRSQADWQPHLTPALFTEVSVEEWPAWRQPTGAQDAYPKGAKVAHNDKHWESDVDNNVWEPGAIGTEALWHEVE